MNENNIKYPLDNIIGEIASRENIEAAYDYVTAHLECEQQRSKYRPSQEDRKRGLTSEQAVYYERVRREMCDRLQEELSTGTFRIRKFKEMTVKDGPKERIVQAPTVYYRVGCHAVMVIVEKYTYPSLIKNTAASIPGRGMHWLFHITETDVRNAPFDNLYYYQCDIHHYYDSIAQWRAKLMIREYVSDPVALPMLDNFIELLPEDRGLSKGLRSSQCFANLFLNPVDHTMCEYADRYELELPDGTFEVRILYNRYCDDIVFFSDSKKKLWQMRNILVHELDKLGLEIKPNEAIRPISEGLDYLGYVDYGTHSRLRKRTKQNAARKLAKIKSRKRRQSVMGSFKGMACHADCKHLYHKLTGEKMKKFNEMGITYAPADGKKRFPGNTTRLASLQNIQLEIHDYEKDIKTSQGIGRYLVSYREVGSGTWGKFFTASEEMKNILDQVSDIEDGFPFETKIVSERFDGNKVKYMFT